MFTLGIVAHKVHKFSWKRFWSNTTGRIRCHVQPNKQNIPTSYYFMEFYTCLITEGVYGKANVEGTCCKGTGTVHQIRRMPSWTAACLSTQHPGKSHAMMLISSNLSRSCRREEMMLKHTLAAVGVYQKHSSRPSTYL